MHEELEAAMTMMNNCLNNGISALDARVDKCEDKHRTLCNVMEDVRATINKQQHLMYDMDQRISFYSGAIVQLEGKKAEEGGTLELQPRHGRCFPTLKAGQENSKTKAAGNIHQSPHPQRWRIP